MLKALKILILALLTFLAKTGFSKDQEPPKQRSSVVLITLDTARADHFSCYGYPHPTTPHIDALARQGAFFEQAFTHAVNTNPSHASLLTGLYPLGHGSRFNNMRLNRDFRTLTQTLQRAGYRTAAFVSGWTMLGRISGFNVGFERYDDDFQGSDRRAEETVDRALAWLGKDTPGQPYFLFVHLFDPHGKYEPPEGFAQKFRKGSYPPIATPEDIPEYQRLSLGGETFSRDPLEYISRYDGEIHYADSQIGRLLKAVGREPVIIFTADHGETLVDRDYYFSHGVRVNEEAIRVPLVLRFPEQHLSQKRIEGIAQLIDILPTTLSYLGLPVPRRLPGRNLVPFIQIGRIPAGKPVISEGRAGTVSMVGKKIKLTPRTNVISARNDRYKLIRYPTRPQPTFELFDLREDPAETKNLAGAEPPDSSIVYQAVDLYLTSGQPPEVPELDEEAIEKLRSLGYID